MTNRRRQLYGNAGLRLNFSDLHGIPEGRSGNFMGLTEINKSGNIQPGILNVNTKQQSI